LVALVEQLERAAIHVVDVPVVRDGRRYSAVCSEPCCPPEGIALPDPADVPGVAEYVALGRSPLRSRRAVEGLVAPEAWRCEGVADAVAGRARMRRLRRRSAAAWSTVLAKGEAGRRSPDRTVVADLALGLADVPWRDGLIAWLAPSVLPSDSIDHEVVVLLRSTLPTWGGMGLAPQPQLLRVVRDRGCGGAGGAVVGDALAMERDELLHRLLAVCRSVPDECAAEAASVCTVAAHVAWIGGDGAIARVAVDRAVRLAPDYRLARLLERLVDLGLRLPPVAGPGKRPGTLGRVG
ncbi:MAG TPA: DUF4192 family protein, partial [Ornithinibacter sp.]|nr:DUF4192 family protein [Ornithinibacter sp.]